jgi:drug/metabolite transporter (DMT)-like permease
MRKIKFQTNYLYEFLLLFVAIIWGSGFIATKVAITNGATPLFIMTIRFLIASILLTVIFIKHIGKISKNDITSGFIVGLFLFLGFAFQTFGLKYTTLSKNAFLTGINVIIVPFICWIIYKKNPPIKSFISAIVCFIGIGLLTLEPPMGLNIGDLLTIGCALFFALHIVSTGYFIKKINVIKLTILQMYFSFLFSFITFLFTDIKYVNITINTNSILAMLYLGIFSTTIAFLIQTYAQSKVIANKTAIFLSTESVFGTIFSIILFGEVLTTKLILGCIIIFISIIISEIDLKRSN